MIRGISSRSGSHWLRYLYLLHITNMNYRLSSICAYINEPISDSLTNVFLDGEACPNSVFDVKMTSTEAVIDVLRDGLLNSCLKPKNLAQSSFRLLVPSSPKLRRIGVFSQGNLSRGPVYGITLYGVTGCFGEDAKCELRMCAAHIPKKQSDGIMCSFTCSDNIYRYTLLDVRHDAMEQKICEIDFY